MAASRLAGLLSKAGEPASEAGSRRQSLETGGGLRAAKAERGTRRWKAPRASRPVMIVDAIGSGRGSAGSSGFGWKGSCLWASEVGQAPRTSEENAVVEVASLGGLARSAARQGPSGARRARLERAQSRALLHRSSVCAVKRPPTRSAACLNRTRRRESIDSLVLVAKRRLSEFGKDASFPHVSGPQGSKTGEDSTARQAQNALGRRGLHRVGRQGCAAPPT